MKLLVVCQYYYPENFQITPICEQLAADGYDVTVLTGLPNYPTGEIPDEYRKDHRDEFINGVHVIRCYEIGRKKGAIFLALNYFSYVFSASRMVKKLENDFDLVFVYQLSPILMGIPGRKYAKMHNIPLLLYCCDIWPESMKVYIQNEGNLVFKWAKMVSKRIYGSAEKIVGQSKSFLPYLENIHGISNDKLIYIPAFADETYLTQDFTPENNDVNFVFLGNLGIAQNLIAVLQAVEKIKDESGFKVHFVGDGTVLDELKQYVKDHELNKIVYFYGRRPVEEMPKFYKLADACLVSLKSDNAIGLTLPTKVQGYMAAGKPIIGMIDGAAKEVIATSDCGICVAAGDVDAFAEVLRKFVRNKDNFKQCGENGRKYFMNNFTKKICIDKLKNIMERMVY